MNAAERKRRQLREREFGEDSWDRAWQATDEKGYWVAPRTLPILLRLAGEKALFGGKNAARVYIELFSQNWGQAVVEIRDEGAHAFRAGYTGDRGTRTWRERVKALQEASFIEVAPKANREIGYVFLRHPNRVLAQLREEKVVDDNVWRAYEEICHDFSIPPEPDPLATGPRRVVAAQPANQVATAGGTSWLDDEDDVPF